jgi:8-oxo-dGTP pyrophosphatase MutT (NUDIX family)
MSMEINGKDVYFVAVKLLLRDGNKLLITHDIFNLWDLPGGRIKKDEFEKPLESVIDRKMQEELGSEVKYSLGEPKVFFRVERIEQGIDMPVRIFAVGYEAKYEGGVIKLGKHHNEYRWVDIDDFKPEELFEGGWLRGLQEYITPQKVL